MSDHIQQAADVIDRRRHQTPQALAQALAAAGLLVTPEACVTHLRDLGYVLIPPGATLTGRDGFPPVLTSHDAPPPITPEQRAVLDAADKWRDGGEDVARRLDGAVDALRATTPKDDEVSE